MTPEDNFSKGVWANIKEARICSDAFGNFLCGKIYNDKTYTYSDGESIITSYIIKQIDDNIWLTRNGITYFIELEKQSDETGV